MGFQRQLTVGILWRDNRSVPQIRLSGRWLKDCGFEPWEKIRVTVCSDALVVRPAGKENHHLDQDESGCNGLDG